MPATYGVIPLLSGASGLDLNKHQSQVSGFSFFYQNILNKNAWNNNNDNSYTGGFSGGYKLVGRTLARNAPYAAHVLVFPHSVPSLCVGSARTDSLTGTFTINYLAAGQYLVAAHDVTGTYRAVAYSLVAAVPM